MVPVTSSLFQRTMHISSVVHYSPHYCTSRWTDSIVNWSGRVCWKCCLTWSRATKRPGKGWNAIKALILNTWLTSQYLDAFAQCVIDTPTPPLRSRKEWWTKVSTVSIVIDILWETENENRFVSKKLAIVFKYGLTMDDPLRLCIKII